MITRRDITRLKSGALPYCLQTQPFIIMREKVGLIFTDEVGWQWSIMDSPEEKAALIIDRETAMEIINKFKMYLALHNGQGSIYELPGSPFKNIYSRKKNIAS